jgi:hypothetical protein
LVDRFTTVFVLLKGLGEGVSFCHSSVCQVMFVVCFENKETYVCCCPIVYRVVCYFDVVCRGGGEKGAGLRGDWVGYEDEDDFVLSLLPCEQDLPDFPQTSWGETSNVGLR